MRKLLTTIALLLGFATHAQTFDFSCAPDTTLDVNGIFPIPSNVDFEHIFFSLAGRNALGVDNIKRVIYSLDNNEEVLDSVVYDPRVDKMVVVPGGGNSYTELIRNYNETDDSYTYEEPGHGGRISVAWELPYSISEDGTRFDLLDGADAIILTDTLNTYQPSVLNGFYSPEPTRRYNAVYVSAGSYDARIDYEDGYRVRNVTVSSGDVEVVDFTGLPALPRPDQVDRTNTSWATDEYYGDIHYNYENWYTLNPNSPAPIDFLNYSSVVDAFKADALRIAGLDLNHLDVTFAALPQDYDVSEYQEGSTPVGAFAVDPCNDDVNLIYINYGPSYNNLSFGQKMKLLYHELGHTLLELDHGPGMMDYNVVNTGDSYFSFTYFRDDMFNGVNTNPYECETIMVPGVSINIQGNGHYRVEEVTPTIHRIVPLYNSSTTKFYGWEFNHEECQTALTTQGGLQRVDNTDNELIIVSDGSTRTITAIFGDNPTSTQGRINYVRRGPVTGDRYITHYITLDERPEHNNIPQGNIVKFGEQYARTNGGSFLFFGLRNEDGCEFVNRWKIGESHEYELLDTFSIQSTQISDGSITNNTLAFNNDFELETGDQLVWFASLSSNQYYEVNADVEVVGDIAILTITRSPQSNTYHNLHYVYKIE